MDLRGCGAGLPSSNCLGIFFLALFLVEQSIAAPMKSTSSSWAARDDCRRGLARSWLSSSGAFGPDIRSAISGAYGSASPREVAPPSSGPLEIALLVFLHAAAPCPEAPHTLSFFTTNPQRCCSRGQGGLFLHWPCWKLWHNFEPSLSTLATDLPLIGLP